MNSLSLKTIGHSNHPIEIFLDILSHYKIRYLVDVRSNPYSRHNPQFNRETLKTDLEINEIEYNYMGDALGARYEDRRLLFDNGIVDFDKVRKLPSFINGIDRLISRVRSGQNISLMCAEKDPLNCHRFVLVARALKKQDIQIEHILADKSTVSQTDLEEQLLKKHGRSNSQLLLFEPRRSKAEMLITAFHKQNMAIGYKADVKY